MADIISNLPDCILCHVLSFVPTKQAVATSLLSKRWRHLWRSVMALDFSNTSVSDEKALFRFNQFVYSVLLSRDADKPIKSFHLKFQDDYPDCDYLGFAANVTKWINFVVQRRLESLNLQVVTNGWPTLPISVVTCRTLVVLKIWCLSFEGFSSVVLPSLKTLDFEDITFPKVSDFMLLLTGCPNLEQLFVAGVVFESEDRSEWKSFSLSKLIQADIVCSCFDFPMKVLQNVESMRIEIAKVYVPNDVIPTFHNLTHLDLMYLNYQWNLLAELLKHCPKLQRLDLDQSGVDEINWTVEEGKHIWVDPEFVPECLSLHLRTCTLLSFLGLQGELLLARYILKNARVLQTMVIWNDGQTNVKRLLSSCPMASTTCKLTVNDKPCRKLCPVNKLKRTLGNLNVNTTKHEPQCKANCSTLHNTAINARHLVGYLDTSQALWERAVVINNLKLGRQSSIVDDFNGKTSMLLVCARFSHGISYS